ncbi:TPA: replication protein RepA [Pseudomonas aeruginosa]|uniref:replication protein RepA n=1 Tax=Pseudomonas aeruginosa TaxID=287 RepID=UPI00234B2104
MKPKHDSKGDGSVSGLSQRHRKLIEDFWAIEQESAVKAGALGCMTRILAQATLPHTDPVLPPGTMYSRSTGQLTLNIAPTTRKYGVPFGTIPRIVLAWICTEAVRTKNRTLILGKSQREFLEKIQLHSNGRDIARMREQCMRLFRAVVSVEYENDQVEHSQRLPITNSDTIFWHKSPDVQSLWNSELELTKEFFEEVLAHPVPLDLRVFHALSKSPLAMDIYTWLTYRMFVMAATGQRIVRVPWLGLKAQLGTNIADTPEGARLFKSRFKQRLAEVLLFYPEAHGHITDEGTYLKLTPCRLHLAPAELRKALR